MSGGTAVAHFVISIFNESLYEYTKQGSMWSRKVSWEADKDRVLFFKLIVHHIESVLTNV